MYRLCARGFSPYNAARMQRLPFWVPITLTLSIAGCGHGSSPTSPSSASVVSVLPPGPAPAGARSTEVRLIDAIAGTPAVGISVTMNSRSMPATDGDGCSTVWAEQAGRYTASFSGDGVVTRTTSLMVPAAQVQVSLIPATFGLTAFEQMFRSRDGQLQRWVSAPRLVIVGRELQFSPSYANDLSVLGGALSAGEQQDLAADLSYGFGMLTDHRLGDFAGVTVESPSSGSTLTVLRTGTVVAARTRGLTAATGYWGIGQWATAGNGEVVAGYLLLDAGWDGPACEYPQFRRSLRIHELGHALGYGHVTDRASVMNPPARLEPTSWDLEAIHIAFQRLPGTTAPDNDPPPSSRSARALVVGPRLY